MDLTTYTIEDEEIEIRVSEDGKFTATYQEEEFRSYTLSELHGKLTEASKAKASELAIPVTVINLQPTTEKNRYGKTEPYEYGTGTVHATLRGRHQRQSTYLLTSEDGKKFQIGTYGPLMICNRLPPEAIAEYLRLRAALHVAKTALENFEGAHAYDLTDLNPPKRGRTRA